MPPSQCSSCPVGMATSALESCIELDPWSDLDSLWEDLKQQQESLRKYKGAHSALQRRLSWEPCLLWLYIPAPSHYVLVGMNSSQTKYDKSATYLFISTIGCPLVWPYKLASCSSSPTPYSPELSCIFRGFTRGLETDQEWGSRFSKDLPISLTFFC